MFNKYFVTLFCNEQNDEFDFDENTPTKKQMVMKTTTKSNRKQTK